MANIGHFEKVRALAASARVLVTAGARLSADAPSEVVAFDVVTNKLVSHFELPCAGLALLLAGEELLVGGSDGALRWHTLASGKAVRAVKAAHAGALSALCLGPDGDKVYSAGADGFVRVWSRASGDKLAEHAMGASPLRAVAVDPSGEFLAAAGDDGVLRVLTLATGARREMTGHEGAVNALAFTPRDGRLCSGGDDGTVRLWYVVGDVECEVRGAGDDGHAGAVLALLFAPTPEATPSLPEPSDRVFSAGADGKVKAWPTESRRKPKTVDYGVKPVYALAFQPPQANQAATQHGFVAFAGDRRTVLRAGLDKQGALTDATTQYGHAFDALELELGAQAPAQRSKAVKVLAEHEEPEALELLVRVLRNDRDEGVRLNALHEVGVRKRAGARAALRELLDDGRAAVRAAALETLRKLDGAESVAPLKLALASKHADLRAAALRALPPLRAHSPLVPGLLAGLLSDGDAVVRLTALDMLSSLFAANAPEPLRTAYDRGHPSLKVEVLTRAARAGLTREPSIAALVVRGLDDGDEAVRRVAFAVKVLERRALAHVLETRDEDLARTLKDLARRCAQLAKGQSVTVEAKGPSDDELAAARKALPGEGEPGAAPEERDLDPLLTAMACHTPDTALRGARGLAQLGDTRALGALLQLSRESSPALRREAARALRELEDPRAKKRLLWMLDDADANVRAAALEAYAKLEAGAPVAIAEAALRSSHEDLRVRGLEGLVKLGADGPAPAEAEALLGDALEDESTKVRGEAFRTLWAWHAKEPVKALDRALEARFADLRLRAVDELASDGKDDRNAWALERLAKTIGDRDAQVANHAYEALVKLRGKELAEPHLLALASAHPAVRAAGAKGARGAPADAVRGELSKLLQDESPLVRGEALDALDKLLPREAGPLYAALQSGFYDLKVRAIEHLAARKDEQLIEPARAFFAEKEELAKRVAPGVLAVWRQRVATALASLGSQRTIKYLATELLKDDDAAVREQAARGLSVACRRGDEGYLLDALGHTDVAVRSWAADGLSRLGDVRALPVLTGNLRHAHLPIRLGAILSFAALGPEGFGGMLQGLEDSLVEVQERVFAIIVARDLRACRQGQPPELLTSALSSQRPEVRFSAARALELRADPESYLAHVLEVLAPPKPEKAGDMKDWPSEEQRGRAVVGLAEALASDEPETRYAAAQVLNLKAKPVEFFREAARVARLRPAGAPVVPETTPQQASENDAKAKKGWLRRLFSGDAPETSEKAPEKKPSKADPREREHLQRLAFGAYVGLLRQVSAGDDEGHRVRRDAVDRIVDLGVHGSIGVHSALPPVVRGLDDPHNLVRKAAFNGLKKLFKSEPNEALSLALNARAADVARGALDELAAQGEGAKPRITAALNSEVHEVRKYAFELLERLSPKGSLEPLFAALASEHASLRVGVLERLALTDDARVSAALEKALESDHDDLRLRAAELLAQRKSERTVEVLAAFLRADEANNVHRAQAALLQLGTPSAVVALATRMDELAQEQRPAVLRLLASTRIAAVVELCAGRVDDESPALRLAAWEVGLGATGHERKKRDAAQVLLLCRAAVRSRDPEVRRPAAVELEFVEGDEANKLLAGLFGDRDAATRTAAVNSYAKRVVEKGAPLGPMREVLRAGARELVLPAAEAVAHAGDFAALRPLLLVSRAGEPGERERALLALGTLGDARALGELETIAAGGTEEAPAEPSMQAAATEALGRIANKLTVADDRKRVSEKVEQATTEAAHTVARVSATRGLRHIGGERARLKLENLLAERWTPVEVRLEAVAQLAALAQPESEAALALALDDYDQRVRTEARKALEKLLPNGRVRVELLAVDSKYADVSQPAAQYLANEGDPRELVPRLASLKSADLRARLRFGLVRRGALPAAETAALLAHANASMREDGAWLTGSGAGPQLSAAEREQLAKALAGAIDLAAKRWSEGRGAVRDEESRAWSRALWAAGRLGANDLAPRARKALTSTDAEAPPAVRRSGLLALQALGVRELELYQKALSDVDAAVRAAAAGAVAAIAPERAAKLAVAVKPFDPVSFALTAAAAVDRDELLRNGEGRRLVLPAMVSRREVAQLVATMKTAKEPEARAAAANALGRVGGPDVIAALREVATDKKSYDEALRKAAYRALRRAGREAQRDAQHAARAARA